MHEEKGIICRSIIQIGEILIDPKCYRVVIMNQEIKLHLREFELLYFFMAHPRWVFTKGQLYNILYDEDLTENIENIIYCLIYNLRRKIEPDPKHPIFIRTVRGVGYKFEIPEK